MFTACEGKTLRNSFDIAQQDQDKKYIMALCIIIGNVYIYLAAFQEKQRKFTIVGWQFTQSCKLNNKDVDVATEGSFTWPPFDYNLRKVFGTYFKNFIHHSSVHCAFICHRTCFDCVSLVVVTIILQNTR